MEREQNICKQMRKSRFNKDRVDINAWENHKNIVSQKLLSKRTIKCVSFWKANQVEREVMST